MHRARLARLRELLGELDLPPTGLLVDLNDADAGAVPPGDVVICMETLEHVGSYRNALRVVHGSAKAGGWIVLSMPNEVGWVGLVKLLGRPLMRRNAYADFFARRREILGYAAAVALLRDLERFRQPPRSGWAPHLGFDHRRVVRHVKETFVEPGLWQVEEPRGSALGANLFLVARRER